MHNIKSLSDREHIRIRPAMYIGSINETKSYEYILEDDKIVYKETSYVPGLIKIINEILDNSVDVAIKSNFESSNVINVTMDKNSVSVEDNGTGIPVLKNSDNRYLPEVCWNSSRAGSNFDDDENRTQIGMNGVGSYATACFSKSFIGVTDDGKNKYQINIINGAESFTEKLLKSYKQGTKVTFEPDLSMFGLSEIDEIHASIIKQRLINLSMTFPLITFKFNGSKINVGSFKKYIQLFSETAEIYETEKYKFAILPNNEDDFRQFSYVNGLKIPDGGMHIEAISEPIVRGIREKLLKKYKTIKPGDIKNKLMIIAFLKDLKNPKFNSQAKEKITNSYAEMNKYYSEEESIPFDNIITKILRNSSIIDPITEIYRMKEELARRKELKGLDKTQKRIKSDKYLPATGRKKYLIVTEGASATGGLMPVLGRDEIGYYELKGKPLNVIKSTQQKFTSNEELKLLYQIIQNEGYESIIWGTDQDLDGIHIRGLLIGFIHKYAPEYKGKIGILNTPVIIVSKNKVPVRWTYNLNEIIETKHGETSKYFKGLGTHTKQTLGPVVEKDGLIKMISMLDFDNDEIIMEWLDSDVEPRKKYITENKFSIAKI